MKKNYVLFIDSGLGGISTLSIAIKKCPYNYIYYSDNLHCPYGEKSSDKIYKYLENIILLLSKKYSFNIVVLACNTATTSAIKKLRANFPKLTFIGTEPAIALAKKNGYKNILCLATPATIKQQKYKILVNSLKINISSVPLKNLAKNIDEFFLTGSLKSKFEIIKYIFFIKSRSKNKDCIVLGCTHYILLRELFFRYITIPILDGNVGVSNMLKSKLSNNYTSKTTIKFIFSYNCNNLKQKYIKILNQILAKK